MKTLLACFCLCLPAPLRSAPLPVQAIDAALGRSGQMIGDVYRVGAPRTDLRITVAGVEVKAGMALGSWMAFREAGGARKAKALALDGATAVHGDLALLEAEVNPVMSKLEELGLEVTSLHNHLMHDQPKVMFLHFWGHGDAVKLAQALKAALSLTGTPPPAAPAPSTFPPQQVIEQALGRKGQVRGSVLQIAVPRQEKITMHGIELPPAMGMATAINFIEAPKGVAVTGDYVLAEDEVDAVIRALRAASIEVTAVHNHMVRDNPRLVFLHFWGHGEAGALARGLKSALDKTRSAPAQ